MFIVIGSDTSSTILNFEFLLISKGKASNVFNINSCF